MIIRRMNGLAAVALVATGALLSACGDPQSTNGAGGGGRSLDYAPPSNNGTIGRNAIDESTLHSWPQNVADRVFFDVDKSVVRPEGRELLTQWVGFLKSHPGEQLVIEGHSDEHGTREYNLALGERRASAVKEFLMINGIQASRIKIVSYGKERPAVIGSNDAAWSQNRRAVGILE